MLNYILGVDLDDSWRFTIQHLMDKDQANQRTNCITWYEVNYQHGNRLKYNLNIIDTPEFCDTRGIDEDKKIVDQIRAFFMTPGDQGIDNIDAVCFVTKAALASLTNTHQYILDSILSLFGRDAKDNIFVLMTFADGNEPLVLEALKTTNFIFKQSFSFNCSGLPDCAYSLEQFENFFEELNHMQQTSLQQTAEVLALKKQIENTIDCLLPQICDGLNQLNTIKQEINVLKNHKKDVYWDRDFSYSLKEIQQRKVDTKPGRCVTNCFVCSFTCHLDCKYTDDKDKKECSAMGPDGYCTKCTGKCHWTKHKNRSFYYETNVQERVEKYEKLKAKYGGGLFNSSSEANAKSHYKSVRQNVMGMMKTAREATNKLEQGSLKPNILNEESYVNCLIEIVKRGGTAGWEDQVAILEEIKSGRESQGRDEDSKYTGCQLC
ncbi:hypothetical protein CHS0354_012231 [Potamilus streckersoni]|uniref:AIG1-type G domain-containing protein n=1 Tax=Potamilus streckersoni TaxID=2493646 RepID=A0AAE0VS95_9BIVA|nr:hypothetical protein CHS0354_012231 [Potamilus streckersoni]